MAMWGDMLLETVRGKGLQDKRTPDGWSYKVSGGLQPAQVARLIPKDILVFNWFWHKEEGLWSEEQGEQNETIIENMGFEQIFGNFRPEIENYDQRQKRRTLLGAAPSAWFATNEFNFGKNLMADFLGCGNIVWNGSVLTPPKLSAVTQAKIPDIRARLRGALPPSRTEASIIPLPISKVFNAGVLESDFRIDLRELRTGVISLGRVPFQLDGSRGRRAVVVHTDGKESRTPNAVDGIGVGMDVSAVLFLHASAKPASNQEADRLIWDVVDSADLLGWYEVVYEDGFVETIPIRYGVNIAEWNWTKRTEARDYCYGADPVPAGGSVKDPITLFAFEWENPRLGKVIRELRLKGTKKFRSADPDFSNHYGPMLPPNAVILAAVSVVNRRGGNAHAE